MIKKFEKCKKTHMNVNLYVFSLNFGHEISFTNISHHKRIKIHLNIEFPALNSLQNKYDGQKKNYVVKKVQKMKKMIFFLQKTSDFETIKLNAMNGYISLQYLNVFLYI